MRGRGVRDGSNTSIGFAHVGLYLFVQVINYESLLIPVDFWLVGPLVVRTVWAIFLYFSMVLIRSDGKSLLRLQYSP